MKTIGTKATADALAASVTPADGRLHDSSRSVATCVDARTHAPDIGGSGPACTPSELARLLTWLSPAFPIGSYSYSHGLEWVVETGGVRDVGTLTGWIEDVLDHGAGRSDAIFLAAAWRAASSGDGARLEDVAELAAAFAPSAERQLETLAQGTAFLTAVVAAWPKPALAALAAHGRLAYPVAVGACTAAHDLPLAATAHAYVQAFAANIVSAAVRLVPLGQSDGLRALARLEPAIARTVAVGTSGTLDDIGGATIAADIASMRHETQYTRLFRS